MSPLLHQKHLQCAITWSFWRRAAGITLFIPDIKKEHPPSMILHTLRASSSHRIRGLCFLVDKATWAGGERPVGRAARPEARGHAPTMAPTLTLEAQQKRAHTQQAPHRPLLRTFGALGVACLPISLPCWLACRSAVLLAG